MIKNRANICFCRGAQEPLDYRLTDLPWRDSELEVSLIRQLFRTEVDLIPDQQNKALTVRLHPLTTQAHDEVVRHICEELRATEIVFPGTDLRLIYEISGSS